MAGRYELVVRLKSVTLPATCGVCGTLALVTRPPEELEAIVDSARCPTCRAHLSAGTFHMEQLHVEIEVLPA